MGDKVGENPAALRAAVFLLSAKNRRGVFKHPPPSRAKVNCIFKLASGVIILSRAAKPKKEKKTASYFHGEFRAVVYQIDNHHMWIKFHVKGTCQPLTWGFQLR